MDREQRLEELEVEEPQEQEDLLQALTEDVGAAFARTASGEGVRMFLMFLSLDLE